MNVRAQPWLACVPLLVQQIFSSLHYPKIHSIGTFQHLKAIATTNGNFYALAVDYAGYSFKCASVVYDMTTMELNLHVGPKASLSQTQNIVPKYFSSHLPSI